MTTTRRSFIKALAAVAAAIGLPVKRIAGIWPDDDESTDLLSGLTAWYQPQPQKPETLNSNANQSKTRFVSVTIWDGQVVALRGYNRALTAKEIQAIADDPWGLYKPVESGGET